MEIYVDVECLQNASFRDRGIGRHTFGVLKYFKTFSISNARLVGVMNDKLPVLDKEYNILFDRVVFGYASIKHADIFLNPAPIGGGSELHIDILSSKNIFCVSLFYDLIPYFFQERYLRDEKTRTNYFENLEYLGLYNLHLSISEASQDDLVTITKVQEDQCIVTGCCLSDFFLQQNYLFDNENKYCKFHPKQYFVMMGGGDNRKNMHFTLRTFGKFIEKYKYSKIGFVFLGEYSDLQIESLEKIALAYKVDIQIPGYLEDQYIANIYHNAIANICPSVAEGFFIPLVEGLACETIPLSSTCKAQCELINNDEEIIFSLDNHSELMFLMNKAYTDKTWTKKILNRHKHIIKKFSTKEVSSICWNSIFTHYESFKKNIRSKEIKQKISNVAVVTPYPPNISGCADYSYSFIKALVKCCSVDVYTDIDNPIECLGVNKFELIERITNNHNEYDAVILIIGNSHFHRQIFEYLLKFGGVCISHDARLLGFYNWYYGFEKTRHIAEINLDKVVDENTLQYWLDSEDKMEYLFLNDTVNSSSHYFVHSSYTKEYLNQQGFKNIHQLPFCPYNELDIKKISSSYKANIKKELGFSNEDILIISFGAISKTKAPEKIIAIFDKLHKIYKEVKLCFIGYCDLSYKEELLFNSEFPEKILLKENYYFTRQEYENYLYATDIGIQLRTYKLGGLSGSVLDCISAGIPTIVNNHLKNNIDTPNYIYGVDDSLDIDEIVSIFNKIIDSKSYKESNNDTINDYLNKHNFNNYVQSLLNILENKEVRK